MIIDESRFWDKVLVDDGCWNWTAGKDTDGYGKYRIGGAGSRTMKASKVSYLLNNGEVPPGQVVRHTCDNRACVRPSHLILGTDLDNKKDMWERGRHAYGERNGGGGKLTKELVREIRAEYALGDWTHRALGRKYGVRHSLIGMIVRREIWRHI